MTGRKVAFQIFILASVLAISLLGATTAQARHGQNRRHRQTMLYTEASAVQNSTGSWDVTATVTNVGLGTALPRLTLSAVTIGQDGQETTVTVITVNRELRPGKSIVRRFTVNAGDAPELVVKSRAKNTPLSVSDPIQLLAPVPLDPPLLIIG